MGAVGLENHNTPAVRVRNPHRNIARNLQPVRHARGTDIGERPPRTYRTVGLHIVDARKSRAGIRMIHSAAVRGKSHAVGKHDTVRDRSFGAVEVYHMKMTRNGRSPTKYLVGE